MKKTAFSVKCGPRKADKTLLILQLGAYTFLEKDDPRKLVDLIFATKVLKYLKPEGEKQKPKQSWSR